MNYKQLGRSGIFVSDLCLGTMIFGETAGRGTPADEARKIIQAYLDAGGNHIDTANAYAGGASEEITGSAIKGVRDQVVLATKCNFPTQSGPNHFGLSRFNIIDSVDQSLKRLDTDYIDLLYVHCWDEFTPLEESMRALDDVVTSGKVRYLGVSNYKAWQVMKALGLADQLGYHRFIAAQYQYSLVKRDLEYEFTDLFEHEGLGLCPWGPLGGGFLSGKYRKDQRPSSITEGRIGATDETHEESWERRSTEKNWNILEVLGNIAAERQVSYPQVALAWLREKPNVSSVILGVRTMEQFVDNMGAAEINLNDEEMYMLDEASKMPELYPYRMIEAYGRKHP
ncbi:MAG: aldo/keto reductase [Bacteroidota bacterium]